MRLEGIDLIGDLSVDNASQCSIHLFERFFYFFVVIRLHRCKHSSYVWTNGFGAAACNGSLGNVGAFRVPKRDKCRRRLTDLLSKRRNVVNGEIARGTEVPHEIFGRKQARAKEVATATGRLKSREPIVSV